jgi:hypothetical protein
MPQSFPEAAVAVEKDQERYYNSGQGRIHAYFWNIRA